MTYEPTTNKILIEADKPRERTASGLYVVEDWKTLPPTGTVTALGPDVKNKDLLGKRVLFERYGAVTVKDETKLCLESHILAIITGEVDE